MKRRDFLTTMLGKSVMAPVVLKASEDKENLPAKLNGKNEANLFSLEPYLQNLAEHEATVMWMTKTKCYSWVEWGENQTLGNKAQTIVDGQIMANNRLNRITISGLESGKKYFYRVYSREITHYDPYKVNWGKTYMSKINTFSTADTKSDSFKAIFFNDIHNNLAVFSKLTEYIAKTGYDLSLFNGDCFNDPTYESNVLKVLKHYNQGVNASQKPVIYLRGNHEIRGAYSRQLPSLFSHPQGKQYFAITRGPVRFVCMDTGEDKPDSHWAYSGLNDFEGFHREQAAWLEKEILKSEFKNAKYRVLVHHIPIYNTPPMKYNPWKKLWGPIFNRAGFDMSIHGHTHQATIYPPKVAGDHNYPIIIGGGPKMENGTVMILEANSKGLNINVLNTKGKNIGSYSV